MNFGLDKRKINTLSKGKWKESQDHKLLQRRGGVYVGAMRKGDKYKYLGFAQSNEIEHKETKHHILFELRNRLKSILKSHLSGKNKIQATNTFSVPVQLWNSIVDGNGHRRS